MTYENQIQSLLYNDTTIQSLVSNWLISTVETYAIFNADLIPNNITTDTDTINLTVDDTTINHYRSGNINGGEIIRFTAQTVNCRSKNEYDAIALQERVHTVLNRVEVERGYFKSIMLPAISPADDTDNFNCPLEIRVTTY